MDYFVSAAGKLVRQVSRNPVAGDSVPTTYSGWGDSNTVSVPKDVVRSDRDLR